MQLAFLPLGPEAYRGLQTGNHSRAESDLLTQYQWEIHFCWLLLLNACQKCYSMNHILIFMQ